MTDARPNSRDELRSSIGALLAESVQGRGRSVVVSAEGGMGKTTFLGDVIGDARAQGFEVLEARGPSSSVELAFASLRSMLRPLDGQLAELAGDLEEALRTAITLGSPERVDHARVALATHRVLTNLAEAAPVLVAVDDADALDLATADVLAFVLDQLATDPVAMVLTAEGELPGPLQRAVHQRTSLPPLAAADLRAPLEADGPITDEVVGRCCELAGGNPFVARELARSLDAEVRRGARPMPRVPRAPETVASNMLDRLAELSEPARRALVVVAADDTGELSVVHGALDRLGESIGALDEAERAGIVELDTGSVKLVHPLWRPVAYHQVAPSSRRAVHRALAAALDRPRDAVPRAWQLAAAAEGRDETAAAALELVAGDVQRRGGQASAAVVYERAASLSPDVADCDRRLLRAARCWLQSGDLDRARGTLRQVSEPAHDDGVLVDLVHATRDVDGPRAARELLDRHRSGGIGPRTTPLIAALDAGLLLDEHGRDEALEMLRGIDLGVAGERVLDEVRRVEVRAGARADAEGASTDRALVDLAARRDRGAVTEAYELHLVDDGSPLAPCDLPLELARADVELLAGRLDDAQARLERVATIAADTSDGASLAGVHWLRGRARLAAGSTEEASALLSRAAAVMPHVCAADAAAAAAASGRADDVRQLRERLGATAPVEVEPAATRVEVARGVLEERGDAIASAVARADAAGLAVEAAEARLAHAEHLARQGTPGEARAIAERAAADLRRMGVRLWESRIAAVLDAAPAEPANSAPELTPAEYRVALAVAAGSTNREAATKLYLSVKTVDFHLQNIYRKLALRSRTELAVRLSHDVQAHQVHQAHQASAAT